ncbi:MAG: glycosyltransferase [Candidatus Levybacteria bacterium]|nr:glycosyltransferase [Candidatus Levybacteria bacterium]
MIKIYAPAIKQDIGGGWTFLRNFKKGLSRYVQFVDRLEDCDLFFISGVTMVEPDDVTRAREMGKPIVLRMDNIPRKSRNKRNRVYDNIKRYSELADIVVYQSKWAAWYCAPMSGPGEIIYNGIDQDIFNTKNLEDNGRENRYLFAYHGKSELKQFWLAHYYFQTEARKNPNAEFWFIYNFKKELPELVDANFDFWNGEKYKHLDFVDDPIQMAGIMKQCKYLIFPSTVDASPNTVLEARACGMEILYPAPADVSGTKELLELSDISLDRMAREYNALFELILGSKDVEI